MAESRCACFARGFRRSVERFLAVGDAGQHRHAQHCRVDTGVAKHPERPETLPWWGRAWIGLANDLFVHARDAEVHGQVGLCVEPLQYVDISHDERTLGDDARRHREVHERLKASTGQPVCALDRLVGVGRGTDRDRTLWPAPELVAQALDEVRAHLDIPIERFADIAFAITSVVRASETVGTGVRTTEVGVQAPLERHSPNAVECASCLYLPIRDLAHSRNPSLQSGPLSSTQMSRARPVNDRTLVLSAQETSLLLNPYPVTEARCLHSTEVRAHQSGSAIWLVPARPP